MPPRPLHPVPSSAATMPPHQKCEENNLCLGPVPTKAPTLLEPTPRPPLAGFGAPRCPQCDCGAGLSSIGAFVHGWSVAEILLQGPATMSTWSRTTSTWACPPLLARPRLPQNARLARPPIRPPPHAQLARPLLLRLCPLGIANLPGGPQAGTRAAGRVALGSKSRPKTRARPRSKVVGKGRFWTTPISAARSS